MSARTLAEVWGHPKYETPELRLLMYQVAYDCGSGDDAHGGIEHRCRLDPVDLAGQTGLDELTVRRLLNLAVERGWLVRDGSWEGEDGLPWRFYPPHQGGEF